MSSIIAIKRTDGGVSLMTIADDANIQKEIRSWSDATGMRPVSHQKINPDEIPQDREFREAWTIEGGTLRVSMPKAKEIFMNEIRKSRNDALSKLDIQVTKALARGQIDIAAQLEEKRQALRDIPSTYSKQLDAASTVSALKMIKPTELEG